MPSLYLPLIISLGICLMPIWLLSGRRVRQAQDYFVALQSTPPDVLRNSSVAYPLRIATFAVFFAWGARGDFWAATVTAACFGVGVYLIYVLRHPLLAFLNSALRDNANITVHACIAKWHGNDARVRLLTSTLSVI